ncbi:MAG: YbdK family carboxylate-amine ligase [Planctomycetota bacterium]
MTKLQFHSNDKQTIGVELEFGVIDSATFALANRSSEVLDRIPDGTAKKCCKHELMQSCIEVISGVCGDVSEARQDLTEKIRVVQSIGDELGVALWWGATHPFSNWQEQVVTDDDRYRSLLRLLQEMARRLVTYGLHVHVGVDSGDKAVMICDRIMQYLPLLLGLSASSPFWENRDTGLHSFRSKVMEGLPTAGLPTLMRNWSEYVWLVNHMEETGFINTIREIWWDVRPHHNFGTVEVRMCDMPGNLDNVCGLAALIQCLVRYLNDEIEEGTYQFDCHPMMVRQNKWRAARYGRAATLVNTFDYSEQSIPEITTRMVGQLRGVAQDLGCESELRWVVDMANGQDWAEHQRSILERTGDPKQVVAELTERSRVS